jgi:hypothetical protein
MTLVTLSTSPALLPSPTPPPALPEADGPADEPMDEPTVAAENPGRGGGGGGALEAAGEIDAVEAGLLVEDAVGAGPSPRLGVFIGLIGGM